ncbi:hypothetical protein XENTR_v10024218 [Xenopus tropicalis]|nr:hypothetical protein XENTR_v10024218 [Xenopus tropicalis]KAE8579868.1 hypothetical protein XENTR_v10024218 [Xenopus tropicalis]
MMLQRPQSRAEADNWENWMVDPPEDADEGPSHETEDVGIQTTPGWTDPTLRSMQEDLATIKAQLSQLQQDIAEIKASKA